MCVHLDSMKDERYWAEVNKERRQTEQQAEQIEKDAKIQAAILELDSQLRMLSLFESRKTLQLLSTMY